MRPRAQRRRRNLMVTVSPAHRDRDQLRLFLLNHLAAASAKMKSGGLRCERENGSNTAMRSISISVAPWGLVGISLAFFMSCTAAEPAKQFRAGAAAVDISPWMGLSIEGN